MAKQKKKVRRKRRPPRPPARTSSIGAPHLRLLEAMTTGNRISFCIDDTPENRAYIEEKTGQSADAFLNRDGELEGTINLGRE